jgi:pimeloyl-ACP methyl ester carboxylesterase
MSLSIEASWCRRCANAIVSVLVACVLAAVCEPAFSQDAGISPIPVAAADSEVPPGSLVDVDGHRLHIWCTGKGRPAVLLEAGLGANHLDWIRVQPHLSSLTTVCSYDRAGYGWSDPGPRPRSVERIAGELRALLPAAGIPTPVIFVGQSFGGLVGMHFAGRYPDAVAGLVLVDSMHPQQYSRFAARDIAVPTGPGRGVIYQNALVTAAGLPDAYRAQAARFAEGDRQRSFMFSEFRTVTASMAAMPALGRLDVPVAVLVHGRRDWDASWADGRMERVWTELQDEISARVGGRPATVVPGAGHAIHLDAPDAVIETISNVVREARAGRAFGTLVTSGGP